MASAGRMKVAVVGHVECVEFALVARMPYPGEIVEAHDLFREPAGGGAVAAVQMARLGGDVTLLTALGEDEIARQACVRLEELGVRVLAAPRAAPTRRALTMVDKEHERTIVTLGERLEPSGEDRELPWGELAQMEAIYFTAGDILALRAARQARVLVASPRGWHALGHGIALDALVMSRADVSEQAELSRVREDAKLVLRTEGQRGGSWFVGADERPRSWPAAEPPGPAVDSYGCGDSFAAGFTYGLALGLEVPAALALGARCGAACLTGRGPYQRQLRGEGLGGWSPTPPGG
jgi:ribokinase